MTDRREESSQEPARSVIVHVLRNPTICDDDGEHEWDGEGIDFEWLGCIVSTVTCSKCGRDKFGVDLYGGPE